MIRALHKASKHVSTHSHGKKIKCLEINWSVILEEKVGVLDRCVYKT